MKDQIKMLLCLGALTFSIIQFAQIYMGNKGALIYGGMVLFAIGFGWYACKVKQEEEE